MKVEDVKNNTQDLPKTGWKRENSTLNAPFLSLSDILATEETLKEFADVFDLEVSYNFLPVIGNVEDKEGTSTLKHTTPFKTGQLQVKNILICKDKQSGTTQVRLLSQADAAFFFHQLPEKPKETSETQEMEVTLYNMTLKVIQSNNEAIASGQQPVVDEALLKKLVQAKFFNGESIYSKQEMEHLQQWIQDKGIERLEKLFTEHILPYKDEEKQKEFPGSPLHKFFRQPVLT